MTAIPAISLAARETAARSTTDIVPQEIIRTEMIGGGTVARVLGEGNGMFTTRNPCATLMVLFSGQRERRNLAKRKRDVSEKRRKLVK
jgi:hypothetical protein